MESLRHIQDEIPGAKFGFNKCKFHGSVCWA